MERKFASQGDLADKKVSFVELGPGVYAYTAEGDPNTGVIVGDDAVMVIDTQATPVMARDVLRRIREVSDRPVGYVVLSHYHAVRVLGASAYQAHSVVASRGTHELIAERGEADMKSEIQRFPRLFRAVDSIPGLTWPNVVFERELTVFLGKREVRLLHLGPGHTKGDTIAWLPKERILFSGDLVEYGATPYAGDAYLKAWPRTLEALRALGPEKLVPGRGEALVNPQQVEAGLKGTQNFVTQLYQSVAAGAQSGKPLKAVYRETYERLKPRFGQWVIFDHCMPFDVSRAYDEATRYPNPRVWTAERDMEMWQALEG